ncbi:MAG: magnesium chelatase domain-containing protein [Moraxellaceae bacterium]
MSLARVRTRAQLGLEAPPVIVEVHLSPGLPGIAIVGLPETAVRESKDRVRSALLNSGFDFPQRRITINLAPADLPKEGGRFDLAIALGILAANGQLPPSALEGKEFLGELALSGELCPVTGVLPASLAARKARGIVSQDPNQSDEPTSSGFMFMAIIASGSLLWGFIGAGIYHLIKNDVYFFALSAAMALMLSFWIWRSRAPYAVDKIIITFAILLGLGVLIPWMI